MNGAFYIGAVGLDAQQRALEIIANNVANISTTGFKRAAVQFSELASAPRDADDLPLSLTDASGVALTGTPRIFSQGALQATGNSFDLAIDGEGFVELAGAAGRSLLWRGGTLKVNGDGLLSAPDGTPLKAMITVPSDTGALAIGRDGAVSVTDGNGASQQIGQIDLVLAKTPDTLIETGSGYYEVADEAQLVSVRPGDEGSGGLVQGALESSNVSLADEMTNLLLTQRAFGASAQVVQAGDQLMQIINSLRRA